MTNDEYERLLDESEGVWPLIVVCLPSGEIFRGEHFLAPATYDKFIEIVTKTAGRFFAGFGYEREQMIDPGLDVSVVWGPHAMGAFKLTAIPSYRYEMERQ